MNRAVTGKAAVLLGLVLSAASAAAQNNADVQTGASSVPGFVAAGGAVPVRIHVVNNGTTTWRAGSGHRLGAQYTGAVNQIRWTGFPCGGYMNTPTDARV